MKRTLLSLLGAILILAIYPSTLAQENDWPRTLPLEQGMVTIYKLQVDEITEDVIQFRAALAYRPTAGAEPIFGAGWFESKVVIDRDNRIVHPVDLKVTDTRFPEGTADVQAELTTVFADESPGWNLDFTLDELELALNTAEAETQAIASRNEKPPRIVYKDHPALLISIDGEPILREIEDSSFQAVINTPYPLIYDGNHYYLNAARDVWYRADEATGPYRFETSPPAEIAAMVNPDEAGAADEPPSEPVTAANAPEIVVSTEPAELIVTEGPAAFVPLVDDLLVLQNSEDDVFMHVSAQQFYIVLAGRWYQSDSLNGPWAYRAADDLPAAFADIPQDSNQADSRVYVAGTPEARDAVMDAQVPQTAAVARGPADVDVEYDGDPRFVPVDGTEMDYANNTGSTVLQTDGLYFLVEDGVWYMSSDPNGPWIVADYRPVQVDAILPSSPVYNTKYVYVYDSTPDVVYVGYTPGYVGSYVHYNTVVYGTGWYYQPWVSPYYYYPRHSTWGFHVGYNPWNGWNFGLSWGWGPFSLSYYTGGYWHQSHYWHHRHYGYWGPGGYRPRHYGHHGYANNRYGHGGYGRNDYRGNDYGRGGHRGNDYGRDNYGRNANGYNRDGRGGNDRYADNGRRPGNRERNSNLYRDGAQQAIVTNTQARPTRQGELRDRYDRPADRQARNSAASRGSREPQQYADNKKIGRNRTGPVSSDDMRIKAQVRDTNREASRAMLLADNNGRVYQSPDRRTQQRDFNSRDGQSAASARNRTTPVSRDGGRSANRNADQVGNGRNARRSTQTMAAAAPQRQAQSRSGETRTRQQTSTAASRQTQTRANDNRPGPGRSQAATSTRQQSQSRAGENRSRQQPRPASAAPARQTQPSRSGGNSNRQRSSQAISAPARQPQPARSSGSSNRQRSSQAVSAPARQPQPARSSGSSNRQRAPQASSTRAPQRQGNNANRPGGNRTRRSN